MRLLLLVCASAVCCDLAAAALSDVRNTNKPATVTNAAVSTAEEEAELDLLQSLLGIVNGDTNAIAALDAGTLSNVMQKADLKQALAMLLEVNDQIHDSGPLVPASSTRHMTRLLNMQAPMLLLMVIPVLILVVRFLFAFAIVADSRKMKKSKIKLVFLGPTLWALAALAGGLMVVALYWLVHHSKLRRDADSGKDRGEDAALPVTGAKPDSPR